MNKHFMAIGLLLSIGSLQAAHKRTTSDATPVTQRTQPNFSSSDPDSAGRESSSIDPDMSWVSYVTTASKVAWEKKDVIVVATAPVVGKSVASWFSPKGSINSVLAPMAGPVVLTVENACATREFGLIPQRKESFDVNQTANAADQVTGTLLVHQGTLFGLLGVGSAYAATCQDSLIYLAVAGASTLAAYWTLQTNVAWRQTNTDTFKVSIKKAEYQQLQRLNPGIKSLNIQKITGQRDKLLTEKKNIEDQGGAFASEADLTIYNDVLAKIDEQRNVYRRQRVEGFLEYRAEKNLQALRDIKS